MSTIKVDTYLTRGGASEIAIDKLKGVSSASSISVVAEGGTNSTNLQQGLTKSWFTSNVSMALTDSFNVASATDAGDGQLGITFSSAFGNTTYSSTATGTSDVNVNVTSNWNETLTTTLTRFGMFKTSNQTYTDIPICGHTCGDLA